MRIDPRFERLFREEYERVYRTAYLLCRDREVAEDATQEAFARCLARWERLADRPWAAGWVTTTAMNETRRTLRRRPSTPPTAPVNRSTVEESIDLRGALRALPARQQEAVVLYYGLDLPMEDRLRTQLRETLAGLPEAPRPGLDGVISRARRLRARRRLLAGVVAAACLAAVATPLFLLAGVGGSERRSGASSGPGVLVVDLSLVPGTVYIEGSVSHVDVRDPHGTLVGSSTGLQLRPKDHLLELTLDPGTYRVDAYQRPCLLGCDFRLGLPMDRCQAQFRMPSAVEVTATIRLAPTKGCTFAFHEQRLTSPAPPRSAPPLPDVAEVVCDQDGTHLGTPQVQPQVDGVHILEHRQDGSPVYVHPPQDSLRFSFPGNGEETVESIYPIAPGQSRILCLGGGRNPSDESLYVPLEVVDEEGLWVSPSLECPIEDQAFRADVLYSTPPVGEAGDPADLVRKYLQGIRADDVVEPAGYPDPPFPAVRVVREDRTIAIVQLKDNGEGRWVFYQGGGAFGFCSSDVGGFGDTPLG